MERRAGKKGIGGEDQGSWKAIALAAMLCVAILPFTWAFLVPTSAVLLRESEAGFGMGIMDEGRLRDTIVKWGWIYAPRALLPLAGTAMGV